MVTSPLSRRSNETDAMALPGVAGRSLAVSTTTSWPDKAPRLTRRPTFGRGEQGPGPVGLVAVAMAVLVGMRVAVAVAVLVATPVAVAVLVAVVVPVAVA